MTDQAGQDRLGVTALAAADIGRHDRLVARAERPSDQTEFVRRASQ